MAAPTATVDLDPVVVLDPVDISDAEDDPFQADARFYEYTKAANPIGAGYIPRVPVARFPAALWQQGPTGVVPLDLAAELGVHDGPATSPALLASFVRIRAGETLETSPNATSELYYVLHGHGSTSTPAGEIRWSQGDFLTLPCGMAATHGAVTDAAFYWVTDEPLLRYLGVQPTVARFRPTRFSRARACAELAAVAAAPGANERSRVSVLLADAGQDQTRTITHTLWAMFGLLPAGQVQRPHRHQSVALDLILDCAPGCYTLLGSRLDDRGDILDPQRVDWEPGGAFVTPPGMWHAHHNDSGRPAHLVPVQDAGLQTYLRSLDIRFSDRR